MAKSRIRKQKKAKPSTPKRSDSINNRKHRPRIELEEGLPFTVDFIKAIDVKQEMIRWQEEMRTWLVDQHERLEQLILQFDPFEMLSQLTVLEIAHNPETYKETEHEGLAAAVEYVALTYLKHPYKTRRHLPLGFHGKAILEASERAKRILRAIADYYSSELVTSIDQNDNTNLDYFRYNIIKHEIFVRNPAYPHHHRQQVEQLFAPYQAWLMDYVGFSVHDLILIEDAMKEVWSTNASIHKEDKEQSRKELIEWSEGARSGKTGGVYSLPHIVDLAKLPPQKAISKINDMHRALRMSTMGSDTFIFSNEDLARETRLPIERVAAATKFFSLTFESVPAGFSMFSPTHELRTKPFIKYEDELLYVSPGSLLWAIQPRLEEAIQVASKTDPKHKNLWVSYQKKRGDYLEQETLALFQQMLKQAVTFQSLSYTFIDEAGKEITTDLDGLVIYDTTLFLVEAKAGNFVPAARRGGKDSIRSVLKKLIGEAHAQAERAKKYILATEECKFTLSDKSILKLKGHTFARIIPVVVTLESLDVFNAVLHEVAKTGLLAAEELPWVVSLDILRVISEVVEFPTQLIHYLKRRLRLNEFKNFYANDELDWFGLYLSNNLYYEKNEQVRQAKTVNVSSQTDQFDAYYAYKTGARKTSAPRPQQQMPALFRQVIVELEERTDIGRSEVILFLLEWSTQARESFADNFRSIRRRTLKDGEPHDFSFGTLLEGGLTCISDFDANYKEQMRMLLARIALRKYEQQAKTWLGLLTTVDQPKLIRGYIVDNEPWQYDQGMDELAKEHLQPLKPGPVVPKR